MMKVPTWQLVLLFLFLYSCSRHYVHAESGISVILVPQFDVDFGYEQVYVALKMAVIGFLWGYACRLSYYLPL